MLYKKCECGQCDDIIPIINKRNEIAHFKKGHQYKGILNGKWRGGIHLDVNGYIIVLKRDHPLCNKQGRIRQHRLVYEEYYNCCLLPWTEIHHINGNKMDNRIENLMPVFRKEHSHIHCKIDMSGRTCLLCGIIFEERKESNKRNWRIFGKGFLCSDCGKKLDFYNKMFIKSFIC